MHVGLEYGPEAHLLNAGAALDAVGARSHQVDADAKAYLLGTYPRLSFKTSMVDAMKDQARIWPESRAAFLVNLGFIGMIRPTPF